MRSIGRSTKPRLSNLALVGKIFRGTYYYAFHAALLLIGCAVYLYKWHPEHLDWWTWAWALLVFAWTVYNTSLIPPILGSRVVVPYRQTCIREFPVFLALSLLCLAVVAVAIAPVAASLWQRLRYVDAIKSLSLDDHGSAVPYPTGAQLGAAFNEYPHRREVPFILMRMGRLLSFDDATSNYRSFAKSFLAAIDEAALIRRYGAAENATLSEASIDPILFLACLIVDANGASKESLERGVQLLKTYRARHALAAFQRLIFEQEIAESDASLTPEQKCAEFVRVKAEMEALIDALRTETLPNEHRRLVTSQVFQEALDHYAQIHVFLHPSADSGCGSTITATSTSPEMIAGLFQRVLTMRQQIVGATDVPWLTGPGKLAIYHFFRHRVGRQTKTTAAVEAMLDKVPGLTDALDARTFQAEAFKPFRDLTTWDRGTPFDAQFAGSGMQAKLVEWMKAGW